MKLIIYEVTKKDCNSISNQCLDANIEHIFYDLEIE